MPNMPDMQRLGNQVRLTESQEQILIFIRKRYEQTGLPPSYREIQEHFGFKAVGTVQDHVKALIRKGALEKVPSERDGGSSKGLIPKGYRQEGIKRLTLYGEIAAGETRDSVQMELGNVVVADSMAKDPCFALRVVGNSMVDAGILEGDYLIVERSAPVRSGDVVVALLDGETTVKRYVKKDGKIWLVPENRRMKPIEVAKGQFEIQGKVVGLQRRL